jgi:putative ABC transport system permease protein
MTAQIPDWLGVVASILLVVLAVVAARWARLGLTRELVWASARAFVQLLAVGALLTVLFTRAGLLGALAWVTGMVVIAGFVAARRSRELPGGRTTGWVAVGIGTATTLGVLLVLGVIEPRPAVVVPVGGMVVNGAMVATNLTMRRLADIATQQRPDIEARLALGLAADEAMAPHLRGAVTTALLPAIDSTKVVGLIALPGAMTGLILAGVEPIDAIRYQIVVMYMLLAAATVSAIVAARLTRRALFDEADRLRRIPAGHPAPGARRARARAAG